MTAAVAPHERHGNVGVAVDDAGHQHLSGPVNDLVEGTGGPLLSNGLDLASLHGHVGVGQDGMGLVHKDGSDVLEKCVHAKTS